MAEVTQDVPVEQHLNPLATCQRERAGSGNCVLVDCPSPTCLDPLDAPKVDFGEFRRRVALLTEEFFCTRDVPDMVTSLVSLGSACFHDELVAFLIRASLDRKDQERAAVVELLCALTTQKLLSAAQLMRGFEKLILGWHDLLLDVPHAPGQLLELVSSNMDLFDLGILTRLPEGLLRTLCANMPAFLSQEFKQSVRAHLLSLMAFKTALKSHLDGDLFRNRSVEAFAAWIRSSDRVAFHHEVVLEACKSLILATPEMATENCKLVLEAFEHLHCASEGWLLDQVDLQLGFSRLLGGIEELIKAKSDAQALVVKLLCGMVEKQLLPAEFLKSARRMRFGGLQGVVIIKEAQRQTPAQSRRVWGSGDKRHFQEEVREAILEYFDSGNTHELGQIIQELRLSQEESVHFMQKLMVTGMERGELEAALDAVEDLLGLSWTPQGVWKAFDRLRETADDLVLDFPYCRERTEDMVHAAVRRGLLVKSYLVPEGDGKVKTLEKLSVDSCLISEGNERTEAG